jgi:threonine dehydrogenase-like Zn-dependent dehydrogenase
MTSAETVWLTRPGAIEFRRESLEPPAHGELLCRTIVTAISPGTELAAFTGQPPLRPSVTYPRLQGYCNVGEVLDSRADGFVRGDRVLSFTSHRSHFLLPAADALYVLPEGADPGAIACTYLYHLGYNAVLRSQVRPGSRVLVIGLGALGLTTVAMAVIAGADVYALSDQPESARIATEMGAREVAARADEEALQALLAQGADVVVTTVNGWSDWQAALRLAGQNGTIACLGFPGRGQAAPESNPLDSQYFYNKQLRIEAVGASPEGDDSRHFLRFNERANIAWLAQLIGERRLNPAQIVSGRYRGQEIARAYQDLIARKDNALTYLLDWA